MTEIDETYLFFNLQHFGELVNLNVGMYLPFLISLKLVLVNIEFHLNLKLLNPCWFPGEGDCWN